MKEVQTLILERLSKVPESTRAWGDIAHALGLLREENTSPRRERVLRDLQAKAEAASDGMAPEKVAQLIDAVTTFVDGDLGELLDDRLDAERASADDLPLDVSQSEESDGLEGLDDEDLDDILGDEDEDELDVSESDTADGEPIVCEACGHEMTPEAIDARRTDDGMPVTCEECGATLRESLRFSRGFRESQPTRRRRRWNAGDRFTEAYRPIGERPAPAGRSAAQVFDDTFHAGEAPLIRPSRPSRARRVLEASLRPSWTPSHPDKTAADVFEESFNR